MTSTAAQMTFAVQPSRLGWWLVVISAAGVAGDSFEVAGSREDADRVAAERITWFQSFEEATP